MPYDEKIRCRRYWACQDEFRIDLGIIVQGKGRYVLKYQLVESMIGKAHVW